MGEFIDPAQLLCGLRLFGVGIKRHWGIQQILRSRILPQTLKVRYQ